MNIDAFRNLAHPPRETGLNRPSYTVTHGLGNLTEVILDPVTYKVYEEFVKQLSGGPVSEQEMLKICNKFHAHPELTPVIIENYINGTLRVV